MSMIKTRIAKLEELSRDQSGALHVPGIPAEEMLKLRRVAATCGSADALATYLRTRLPGKDADVISLEDRRRNEAVLAAAARTIFEEVRA